MVGCCGRLAPSVCPWEKGGSMEAPAYPREIEIERVMNVVRGFGWEEVKQEIIGDELILTVKKKVLKPGEVPGEETPT